MSGNRRPLRTAPTVLYWADDAVQTVERWNAVARPFDAVAVENLDSEGRTNDLEQNAIDCAILEVPHGDADPTDRVETLREQIGPVPTIVVSIGQVDPTSIVVPPSISGYVTIAPSQDRVALLTELVDQVADVVAVGRDQVLLTSLLDQIPLSVYVKDRDGRHLAVSDSMLDMVGQPFMENEEGKRHHHPADVRGKTDFDLYPAAQATETVHDDRAVVETGDPVVNKVEHAFGEEGTGVYVLTSKAPWYDRAGTVRGIVGMSTEVSRRKRYEHQLRRQNERLRRLTTAFGREIRSALSLGLGRLELARETGAVEHFETLSTALDRIETVVENVLCVTRQGERVTAPEPVSLAAVVRTAFGRLSTEGLSLRVRTEATIQADPGRVQHLLEQLFENAREHGSMEGSSSVTVTVDDLEGGFSVADDGVGIDADDREAVFEPGLSMDDDGGIGLNVVAAIADAHGWTVTIDESANGGARIDIRGVERIEE